MRTCVNGHQYYKSSDCPICPVCEKVHQRERDFISLLAAPAKRALANNGITTLQQLSGFCETELLKLHGIGQASIPTLKIALQKIGLNFKHGYLKNHTWYYAKSNPVGPVDFSNPDKLISTIKFQSMITTGKKPPLVKPGSYLETAINFDKKTGALVW